MPLGTRLSRRTVLALPAALTLPLCKASEARAKKAPNVKADWIGSLTTPDAPFIPVVFQITSQKKNGSISGQAVSPQPFTVDFTGTVSKKGKITGEFRPTIDEVEVRIAVDMKVQMDDGYRVAIGTFEMFDEHGGLLREGTVYVAWVDPNKE